MKEFTTEIQNFINANLTTDLHSLLLRKSPFADISMQEIVQQIKGRKVAGKKFPFLLKEGIHFPAGLSLEQSSSEATARYKANLMQGERLVDLTSGFGIDAYFLSQNFRVTTLVEQNSELLETVRHNWDVLNRHAIFVNNSAERFLADNKTYFDWVYLDPARRDERKNKVFLLEDLSPDILKIRHEIAACSRHAMIKLSPLIDISYLVSVLADLAETHIVAVKNDVKELLAVLGRSEHQQKIKIVCANLETAEPCISFNFGEENTTSDGFSEVLEYLYIPNNSLLKSGAFNLIGLRFGLHKLHPNTHLYTSATPINDFPGRVLRVQAADPKTIEKDSQFNILSKNYPLKPEEIKKKYRLRDGGDRYLIFTQDIAGKVVLKSI